MDDIDLKGVSKIGTVLAKPTEYTDDQVSAIARGIISESLEKKRENSVNLGKHVDNDWDAGAYIKDLYEQFLQTVQQGHELKHHSGVVLDPASVTFEKYLNLCLETLKYRREELKADLAREEIDLPIYNNAKMLADMSEEAISKYLEQGEVARLIGV